MPRMYQPPDYYRPSGTGRIVDLMLRRGDIQAEGAARSGQIWGGAVRGLGDIATSALQQRSEEKALEREAVAKRQRETDFIQGLKSGKMDRNGAMEIFGAKDGLVMWNAVEASEQMAQKQGAEAMGHLKDILVPFVGMSPETQQMIYPQLRGLAINSKLVPPDQIPEQLTPEFSEVLSNMAHQLNPKEKPKPVEVNGQLVDPTSGDVIGDYRNDDKPPAPTEWSTLLDAAGGDPNKALELDQRRAIGRRAPTAGNDTAQSSGALAALPSERRAAIDFVTNSMPKDRKRSWIDTITREAESGDDEKLRTAVRSAAFASELAEAKKTVTGRLIMVTALKGAREILNELKNAGVKTNILRGTAETVAGKLGMSTDPRLRSLATQLMSNLILYRQAVSGAAFSKEETKDYVRVNPNYSNTFEVNEAVIDGMLKSLDQYDKGYWEQKVGPAAAPWIRGESYGPSPAPTSQTKPPNPFRAK